MNASQRPKETTIWDLFTSSYAVIEPLLSCVRDSRAKFVFTNEREVMSLFTDFINTDKGGLLVRQWYEQSRHTLAIIEYVGRNINSVNEDVVRLAHQAARVELNTLTARLVAVTIHP